MGPRNSGMQKTSGCNYVVRNPSFSAHKYGLPGPDGCVMLRATVDFGSSCPVLLCFPSAVLFGGRKRPAVVQMSGVRFGWSVQKDPCLRLAKECSSLFVAHCDHCSRFAVVIIAPISVVLRFRFQFCIVLVMVTANSFCDVYHYGFIAPLILGHIIYHIRVTILVLIAIHS